MAEMRRRCSAGAAAPRPTPSLLLDLRTMLKAVGLAILVYSLTVGTLPATAAAPAILSARSFPAPPVRARAALVLDANSDKVLMQWNAHRRLPMASTTKMMTALLAIRHGKLTDRIVVPAAAFNFESDATVMGLRAGETVTLRDLLYGLLLPSGADAANTIAIHYGGTEARFVGMMNREAAALGLRDTHYVDATGLSSVNHYSSAYDLAMLGRQVSRIPALMQITATRTHLWNGHVLQNVNHVLFWYPGVDGIKPGFTYQAGLCQVIDARRDGRHVIVAILNTPDLVVDARNLLNFGLRDFTWVQSQLPGDAPAMVLNGSDEHGAYAYFPGSGHYLRAPFAQAYERSGGLAQLGFPRTEPLWNGYREIQYFQNGALALNPITHVARYYGLGVIPLPSIAPPSPTPLPTPTLTPTPGEGAGGGARTPTPGPVRTPTPRIVPTGTPVARPGVSHTDRLFVGFARAHSRTLGAASSQLIWLHHFALQVFTSGALLFDPRTHVVYRLPLGDRVLALHRFLPAHPGTAYPPGFAPVSILRAVGWLR